MRMWEDDRELLLGAVCWKANTYGLLHMSLLFPEGAEFTPVKLKTTDSETLEGKT